jgi:type II secretory pathway pseudopilin PulG
MSTFMAAERPVRRGFALIAAIVFVAVMAVIATVITVSLSGDNDARRIRKAADGLLRLAREIDSVAPSFRTEVRAKPGRLTQLVMPITAAMLDACGGNFTVADANRWNGPYHPVPIGAAGYPIAPGFVATDVLAANVARTRLPIVMNNVAIADAEDLGLLVDGVSTGAGPVVTFTPNGTNPVTVSYNVLITGCKQ